MVHLKIVLTEKINIPFFVRFKTTDKVYCVRKFLNEEDFKENFGHSSDITYLQMYLAVYEDTHKTKRRGLRITYCDRIKWK